MKEPQTLGFEFVEIPLSDAEAIVAAGNGHYADIIVGLSKKLPELEQANMGLAKEQRKTFAFNLPNGKVLDPKQIKSLCHSVNLALTKSEIYWMVRYSERRKMFVCVPKLSKFKVPAKMRVNSSETDVSNKRKAILAYKESGMQPAKIAEALGMNVPAVNYYYYDQRYSQAAENPKMREAVLSLRSKGLGYMKIANQLNLAKSTVRYYLSKKLPKPIDIPKLSASDFVQKARDIIDYHAPFMNGPTHTECMRFRAAASVVGTRDLHFSGNVLDEALGFKNGGSSWYANRPEKAAAEDLQKLRRALNIKGGK